MKHAICKALGVLTAAMMFSPGEAQAKPFSITTTCSQYIYIYEPSGSDWRYVGRTISGKPITAGFGPVTLTFVSFSGYSSHSEPSGKKLETKTVDISSADSVGFSTCP